MRRNRLFANTLRGGIGAMVLIMLSVSMATNVSACFVLIPDFPQAFEASHAVFIGEVVKITKPDDAAPGPTGRKRFHEVTFKVEYSWKGAGFQEIGTPDLRVLSSQGSDFCLTWPGFVEGRKYLVYATETPEKELMVSGGTRTMTLEMASSDLKKLNTVDFFREVRAKQRLTDKFVLFD